MPNNPKVSVIVPVYNVEKYLRRCLDSIANQDFCGFECICVDDGSTDGSGKILDEYAQRDDRFVVKHQSNQGVSVARNLGLDCAKGKYVTFVDSDDWIERNTYSTAYALAKEKNLDIIQWTFAGNDLRLKVASGAFSIEKDVEYFSASPWCKLIRRNIIEQCGIRYPIGIRLSEDRLFCFECYLNSKLCYFINEPFYHYEYRETSASHSMTERMILEEVDVIRRMENLVKDKKDFFADLIYANKCQSIFHTLMYMTPPAIKLSRSIFPEVNWKLVRQRRKFSFVFLLVCLHLDALAFLTIKLWKKIKEKRSR